MAKQIILEADLGGMPVSAEELAQVPDFADIRPQIWGKFPGAIAKKTYRAGEFIFHEGEHGTTACYILSGEVEVFLKSPIVAVENKKRRGWFGPLGKLTQYVKGAPAQRGREKSPRKYVPVDGSVDLALDDPITTLGSGELIGELAALAALKQDRVKRAKFYPRSASVRAKSDVVVFEMLPNILNNVLYNSKTFKQKLADNYRDRALETHLRSVPMFAEVDRDFIEYLRQRVELVDVQPGQEICRQGEAADAFYLIRLGFVKVSQTFAGGELVLNYLSRGSYFGEIGLLPPAFRIRARGKNAGEFAEAVLSSQPLTCGRAPSEERSLEISWDSYISREHFSVRVDGRKVRVEQFPGGKNPITYRMQPTASFVAAPGESFVAGGTTFEIVEDRDQTGYRTATCTAMDFVQLVRITAEDFGQMLAKFPAAAAAVETEAQQRRQMNAGLMNRLQTVSLNDFLTQELVQGQNLLMFDLDRCTRCDECVDACIATHEDGVTRLIREGLRFDKYLVPTSCRACMDPLCMTRCPVGSIRRKDSLDIVIEDWCIGCGNCAVDCPYGNINIVPISGLVQIDGQSSTAKQKAQPAPKATTCDLCVDYDEPNCVRACPHEAAMRVDPKEFFAHDLAGMQLAVTDRPVQQAERATPMTETILLTNIADLSALLPRLRVRSGPRPGRMLQLRFPATSFGRGPENDYRLTEEEMASRQHCVIEGSEKRFLLRDLGSTNGTFVNGNRVEGEIELRPGDVIRIGKMEMEFLWSPDS